MLAVGLIFPLAERLFGLFWSLHTKEVNFFSELRSFLEPLLDVSVTFEGALVCARVYKNTNEGDF